MPGHPEIIQRLYVGMLANEEKCKECGTERKHDRIKGWYCPVCIRSNTPRTDAVCCDPVRYDHGGLDALSRELEASLADMALQRDNWKEEARQYCENASYWRERHEECGKKNGEIGAEMIKDKGRIMGLEEVLNDLSQEADHRTIGEVRAAINVVLQPNSAVSRR